MSTANMSSPEADTLVVESSERSLAPEITYADALAASPRLRELSDQQVMAPLPRYYRPTKADFAAWLTEKPSSANGYLDRGNALMDAHRYDEAIADFSQALVLDPKNVVALADRALAHVQKNDVPAGEVDIAAAKALQVDNAVLWRAEGLVAEQKGDYAAAIEAYTASLKSDPTNSFAVGHRAICYHEAGKNEEALADSERALKADPKWMNLRLMRASIFFIRGNSAAVAREADIMLTENPRSDYAYVAAARMYARIDRKADAMKAFDAALAIRPAAYIYFNRAQTRPRTDHARRIRDLDAALKVEPDNTEALAEKAEELVALGNLKGALALYDNAMRIAPDNINLAGDRAIVIYKLGRTAEAAGLFKTIRGRAKTASELNAICWSRGTAGILLESALQDCLDAVKMRPSEGPYLDSLGMVLLKLGRLDDALEAYNQAVAKNTGADSLMGRAFVYLAKKDRPRAEADAAMARKLYAEIDSDFAEYGLKFNRALVDSADAPQPAAH
jgi:tetratricopeptide (TPR) repeat protein